MYQCGICTDPVTFEEDSICCDTCNVWIHKRCIGMSTTILKNIANTDVSWICPSCNEPNFSSILFNTPSITSDDNRFSILAHSMYELDGSQSAHSPANASFQSHFSSPGSPSAASSPKQNNLKQRSTKENANFKVAIVNCQSINNKVAEFQTFIEIT